MVDILNKTDSTENASQVKEFTESLITEDSILPSYTKEVLLNNLVKCGYYPLNLLANMPLLMKYLTQNGRLFTEEHPMIFYKANIEEARRADLVTSFNKYFIGFCEQNELILLLWKFVTHYK